MLNIDVRRITLKYPITVSTSHPCSEIIHIISVPYYSRNKPSSSCLDLKTSALFADLRYVGVGQFAGMVMNECSSNSAGFSLCSVVGVAIVMPSSSRFYLIVCVAETDAPTQT